MITFKTGKIAREIGPAVIVGDWSDTSGYQFIVLYQEAGPLCTVLMLGGYDYGGGVTHGSCNVPMDRVDKLLDTLTDHDLYSAMSKLVKEYGWISVG
jgi:hypothetical protein